MKFGHTLYDLISQEWHPYAVDYKGMKQVLKGDTAAAPAVVEDDDGSPASAQQQQKVIDTDEFFRLFEASKTRIHLFYSEREKDAHSKMTSFKDRVLKQVKRHDDLDDGSSKSTSSLAESLSSFQEQLDLLIEFLDLNKTGFSKILKKYDKRVGATIRQEKFEQLMTTHVFLNGEVLFHLKEEIEILERQLFQVDHNNNNDVDHGKDVTEVEELLDWVQTNSKFFNENTPRSLPHFQPTEVVLGALLGKGEFGVVREVSKFDVPESCHICYLHMGPNVVSPEPSSFLLLPNMQDAMDSTTSEGKRSAVDSVSPESHDVSPITNTSGPGGGGVTDFEDLESDHEDDEEGFDTRGFMKDHCIRDGAARYALKILQEDVSAENREAAADIAMEAKFLAVLAHPNIVKMRGSGGVPGNPDFFIILDRLYDTLDQRCEKWAMHEKKAKGFLGFKKNQAILGNLWVDRLVAAFDIARAMKYLHSHSIVFRDLKPENVGFDIRGDAKIFDFGLAKELLVADQVGHDQFQASGMTGTRRYMPPEVALCKPYGLSADMYSFAILFWEVLSLKVAYQGYDYEKHANRVVLKGKRPKIPSSCPALLKSLLKDAWSNDPTVRPPFTRVCDLLRGEISSHEKTNLSTRSVELLTRSESSMYRGYAS